MNYQNLTYQDIYTIADAAASGGISETLTKQIIVACTMDLATNLPDNTNPEMKQNVQTLLEIIGVGAHQLHRGEQPYLVTLAQKNPKIAKLIAPTLNALFQ